MGKTIPIIETLGLEIKKPMSSISGEWEKPRITRFFYERRKEKSWRAGTRSFPTGTGEGGEEGGWKRTARSRRGKSEIPEGFQGSSVSGIFGERNGGASAKKQGKDIATNSKGVENSSKKGDLSERRSRKRVIDRYKNNKTK